MGPIPAPEPIVAPAATPRFVSAAAGDAFVCALGDDGSVWCWGRNASAELGRGRGLTQAPGDPGVPRPEPRFDAVPRPIPDLDAVVSVAAARYWACAVRRDGTVWCWGDDHAGKIGGDPSKHLGAAGPSRVAGLDSVVQVALGESHGVALRSDGTVWCWGDDYAGKHGDRARFERGLPEEWLHRPGLAPGGPPAPGPGPIGGPSGGVRPPGSPPEPPRDPPDPRPQTAFGPTPVPGITQATAVAASRERSAAIVGGEVWQWGRAAWKVSQGGGEIGPGPVDPDDIPPRKVDGLDHVRQVALYDRGLVALRDDGTVWRYPDRNPGWPHGPRASDQAPPPEAYPDLAGVAELAVDNSACVRLKDGTVRCWGHEVLRGDEKKGAHPPSELPLRAVSVSHGREFVVVVDQDGVVWAWGAGWAGQLGPSRPEEIGESASWFVPTPVRVIGPG